MEIIDLKKNFKRSRCRWRNNDDGGTIAAADAAAPLETSMPDKKICRGRLLNSLLFRVRARARERLDDSIGFRKAWNGPCNKCFLVVVALTVSYSTCFAHTRNTACRIFDRPRR